MAPYLILGFLIAGILHVYLPKSRLQKFLGKSNLKSSINAALLGIPLPLCSCGVIPTGVSLYRGGASKGSTVSFLISTPQTGIDSILVTYSMLGLPFAIIRPIVAFVTGITGGWFTDKITEANKADISTTKGEMNVNSSNESLTSKFKRLWNYAFVEFLNDISKWLVIGLLLAAFLSVLLPEDFFTTYVTSEYLELLIMLIASIPMYVCATASVPIAAVLMAKGLSPGAALVFLMAGPATNVATILVIGKSMGRKTLISYLIAIITGAIAFGLLINEIDPIRNLFGITKSASHGQFHLVPEWLGTVSVVFLIFLIVNGYLKMKLKKPKEINSGNDPKSYSLNVKGMNCSHCENNVITNVSSISGVKSVRASFGDEKVSLSGKEIDIDKVKEVINNLGYEVVE